MAINGVMVQPWERFRGEIEVQHREICCCGVGAASRSRFRDTLNSLHVMRVFGGSVEAF
jgi:hypothetical protein